MQARTGHGGEGLHHDELRPARERQRRGWRARRGQGEGAAAGHEQAAVGAEGEGVDGGCAAAGGSAVPAPMVVLAVPASDGGTVDVVRRTAQAKLGGVLRYLRFRWLPPASM